MEIIFVTRENQGWEYSSVVKFLPSIYKALGLIPSTTRKEKKTRRNSH
jgi:hypothetical protein